MQTEKISEQWERWKDEESDWRFLLNFRKSALPFKVETKQKRKTDVGKTQWMKVRENSFSNRVLSCHWSNAPESGSISFTSPPSDPPLISTVQFSLPDMYIYGLPMFLLFYTFFVFPLVFNFRCCVSPLLSFL